MASVEHKKLAQYLKDVHATLRKTSIIKGPKKAWLEHIENNDVLTRYAEYMELLATSHWDTNSAKDPESIISRIKWSADFCYEYFIKKTHVKYKEKDINISQKNCISLDSVEEHFTSPIHMIDVGSCYNPFKDFEYLNVLAVDLCPANDTVMQCDFLNVCIGSKTILEDCKVIQLQQYSYDVVTFCFLLEYIPDSSLRIKACENAYNLLKPGGLLIIITPDSKHVGANSKIMKCWRYTLGCMGLSRIKYEKFKHMHCMVFRKSLHKDIAIRWSKLHKECYMEYAINIPQDFHYINEDDSLATTSTKFNITEDDLKQLPFFSG